MALSVVVKKLKPTIERCRYSYKTLAFTVTVIKDIEGRNAFWLFYFLEKGPTNLVGTFEYVLLCSITFYLYDPCGLQNYEFPSTCISMLL